MTTIAIRETERARHIAERLDCFIEEDFQCLAAAKAKTVEAWRKRGIGPAYILLGNRYLYPRKAVEKYLDSTTRERKGVSAKEALQ